MENGDYTKASNLNLINEFYSKCFKQKQDIADAINEIMKGEHKIGAIDKVKDKIREKLENFEESLRTIERITSELTKIKDKDIWKKKIENLRISLSDMSRNLEEAVSHQKKKFKGSNLFFKIGSDMERQASLINSELGSQKTHLESIKDKVNRMYNKLEISNTITNFLIRRGRGDTFLCLFLGVLTIIIIYFIYYYVKPWIRGEQNFN